MNKLVSVNSELTMSSVEIAGLCDKRHDNVKRTIEMLAERGVISLPQIEEVKIQRERREEAVQAYMVGKRDSYVVVAQLSPEFTARLVDRWQELESATPKIPQTYAEALRLAADQAEQIALMAPKADVFDKIVDRGVLMTATQAGQKIGMSAVKLNSHLLELGVYNASVKRSRAFKQWFVDKGLGEMKQTELGYSQALFTNAGEAWIVEKFSSEGII